MSATAGSAREQCLTVEPGLRPGRGNLLPERRRTGEERWFVLHVMSRQEKVLAAALTGMGLDCYLPLRRQVTFHGRRKAVVVKPLFPGYVFLWGSPDEAYSADRTRKVANLISVPDQERLEWELENIHLALSGDAPLEDHPPVANGERALVRAGPMKGLEGVVQRRARGARLVLQVEMLGSAVSLEIEGSLLEPAG